MNILEVHGLCKNFDKFQLKNVDITLEEGFVMGFIGRNGAGKTTTLKAILNLMNNDGGSISICGLALPKDEIEIKKQVGYVFGGVNFYPEHKIKKITNITKEFYENWDENRYKELCQRFEIDQDKKFKQLSSGMKVKYALAVAMSHNPRLLILDEPTSGLDPAARDDLICILQEFIEDGQHSVLFSTHITSDLEKCADYITYIKEGKVIASAEKSEFKNKYLIVAGKKDQLTEELNAKLIGCHTHQFGFEALMKKEDEELVLSTGIESAEPTLEDIMVHIERR